jgi:hypothetical protein
MQPQKFKYLKAEPGQRARADCLENVYDMTDAVDSVILREDKDNSYLLFRRRADFEAWYDAQVGERNYYEMIPGGAIQHPKFDVDMAAADLEKIPEACFSTLLGGGPLDTAARADAVMNAIIDAFLAEALYMYYERDACRLVYPTRAGLYVLESSGEAKRGYKYSFHGLILNFCFPNNHEAREFTHHVVARLPEAFRPFLDVKVNSNLQAFRLPGSAKLGSGRVLRMTDRFGTATTVLADDGAPRPVKDTDLLVRGRANAGEFVLPELYERPQPRADAQLTEPLMQAALALARGAGTLDGFVFNAVFGTLLTFTRVAPSWCPHCNETHHKDNSLMVALNTMKSGAVSVHRLCRQARGHRILLGTLDCAAEDAPAVYAPESERPSFVPLSRQERLQKQVAALAAGERDAHAALASAFETLPGAHVYDEPEMRDYEVCPTLAVCAQMGTGKTKALQRHIASHFAATPLRSPHMVFVSFRLTFSQAVANSFNKFDDGKHAFELYSAIKEPEIALERHPRLIVQVESMHRIRVEEPVDLLILDEVESILSQFHSGLGRQFEKAYAVFEMLLRSARHVIVMDANLSDRSYNYIRRVRGGAVTFHWNQHRRAVTDTYRFTALYRDWLAALFAALRDGQRLVIPVNSLKSANTLDRMIREEFPERRVALYSSETCPEKKKNDFENVKEAWGGLDVLIYTPTCSAGVSFEDPHYDAVYAFFNDMSCDVEACRQMMARVRRLSRREYVVCLETTGATLPDTAAAVRAAISNKRSELFRDNKSELPPFSYNDRGEPVYFDSSLFTLWVESMRVKNLSRNAFMARFTDQVADTGAVLTMLAPTDGEALLQAKELLGTHGLASAAVAAERAEAVAAAPDITEQEADDIRDRLTHSKAVTMTERHARVKHLMRSCYAWHGRLITPAFVARYEGAAPRRVYENLKRITALPTVDLALEEMRRHERYRFEFFLERKNAASTQTNEAEELVYDKRRYVAGAHEMAIGLIRACRLELGDAGRTVDEVMLEASLRAAFTRVAARLDDYVYAFEVRRFNAASLAGEADRAKYLKRALAFVNSVLGPMYGLRVKQQGRRSAKNPDAVMRYALENDKHGELFVFSETAEPDGEDEPGRPHIPSKLQFAAAEQEAVFTVGAADPQVCTDPQIAVCVDPQVAVCVGPQVAVCVDPQVAVCAAPQIALPAHLDVDMEGLDDEDDYEDDPNYQNAVFEYDDDSE